jgi:hypothetical protein
VRVPTPRSLTLEQWLAEFERLKKLNAELLKPANAKKSMRSGQDSAAGASSAACPAPVAPGLVIRRDTGLAAHFIGPSLCKCLGSSDAKLTIIPANNRG